MLTDATADGLRRRQPELAGSLFACATVERFVLAAALPGGRVRARLRAGVLVNRDLLLELAGALRADAPVYARGVAELRLALRDGAGPFYMDRQGEALARQLATISAGLRG